MLGGEKRWDGRLLLLIGACGLVVFWLIYGAVRFYQRAGLWSGGSPAVPAANRSQPDKRPLYKVIKVLDGDTIDVEDASGVRTRVRFRDYDAPEMDEPGGPEAKDWMITRLGRGPVSLRAYAKDKYGRTIANVYLRDGTHVRGPVAELRDRLTKAVTYGKHGRCRGVVIPNRFDAPIRVRWTVRRGRFPLTSASIHAYGVLFALRMTVVPYSGVEMQANVAYTDDWGRHAETPLLTATYTRQTIRRIRIAGFTADRAFAIADSLETHAPP